MHCTHSLSRRSFLISLPGLLAAEASAAAGSGPTFLSHDQVLATELNPEEKAVVEGSRMAQELAGYFQGGYSCAESILMVALRFLHKSEDLVWAAAGFGVGLGRQDLCGFLTGGAMGCGLAAGELSLERDEAKRRCRLAIRSFLAWWDEQAPQKCADIRKPGTSGAVCTRLGRLAAARIESLIVGMRG